MFNLYTMFFKKEVYLQVVKGTQKKNRNVNFKILEEKTQNAY